MTKINVFLCDDHQLILDGLQLVVDSQADMQCIGTARNGEELLEALAAHPARVVLLAINLPGLNGIETCRRIQQQYPQCRVIGLSMANEVALARHMLKYGAKGYLLKTAGKEEVLKAIRRVHSGETYYSSGILDTILNHSSAPKKQRSNTLLPKLSRREKEVLELIIQEYTTNEIGARLFISPGTVETHRKHLLAKLNARNTAGLVRISMEYGLF